MPRDEYDDDRRTPDEYDPGFDRPGRRRRPPPRKAGNTLLWVFGGVGCLGLVVCGGLGGLVWWVLAPTRFPEQAGDYADARKAFRTTLTTAGPAPQGHDPLDPPPGVEVVEYKSGNLTLAAWTTEPPAGGARQPAVLYLHSGFAFGPDDWEEAEPLRKAGFAVFMPILRGENGQPGNYTLFCDEVADAVAATDALAKRPGVDTGKLFVAGYSSGGTLAMLTAMADKRFKGCGAISGSPDQGKFTQVRGADLLVPFDRTDPKEIAIRSPLAWPKSFKCPARLYVGRDELQYMWATNKLAEKARAAGADVQCEELDGDHDTVVRPALERMIGFFQTLE